MMENLVKTNEAMANDIAKDQKMTYLERENDGGTFFEKFGYGGKIGYHQYRIIKNN